MNKSELVTVREGREEDKGLIYSTWLKGLRFGNEWFGAIEQDAYFSAYHRVIESILAAPSTVVTVACLVEDPDVVLGYSVCSGDRIHWTFVKRAWRRIGIAKSLTSSNATTVTHLTDVGKSIATSHKLIFNPFLIP